MSERSHARLNPPQGDTADAELVSSLRARVALLENQLQTSATPHDGPFGESDAIAVVGSGCRFPGSASSPDEFWGLLCAGTDAISKIPPARFDVDEYFDADAAAPGTMNVKDGGFLAQPLDHFDTVAFSIAPREARHFDPQQRRVAPHMPQCFSATSPALSR